MAHDAHAAQDHPFHLVNPSPWPLVASMSLLLLTLGAAMSMHGAPEKMPLVGNGVLALGLVGVLYVMLSWWRDVIKEGHQDKAHTSAVSFGLRMGMGLFITSEVMFFVAFFWAFFDSSLMANHPIPDVWPVIEPSQWPPVEIKTFDAWHLPFLNTLILLLSGTTVTWAHYALLKGDLDSVKQGLWYTVILGFSFTGLQALEYSHAAFGLKDGIYASTFFLATGFHGLHVIIGTIFLAVCLRRCYTGTLTKDKHLGFEFAAWYWHFVDVVWIFLFVSIYWWGSIPRMVAW
jgi:cytochrome c oxidase subunit 3